MELLTISAFCIILLIFLSLKLPILLALAIGLCIFISYSLYKGFSFWETMLMCYEGVKTIHGILLTFLLIGILTAVWRASATIPSIICYSSSFFVPSLFLTVCFLLNCLVSFLTGTSFGTAATIGVICSTMGYSMHIPPVFMGGAILSGAYFGDRCSPLSTSALLVSELTKTDIFSNIRGMLKTSWLPFLLACALYTILGFALPKGASNVAFSSLFEEEFSISVIALLPAALVLILSLLRFNVKKTMLISILVGILISIVFQKTEPLTLCKAIIWGYQANSAELGIMINGGGLLSMLRVTLIVCLSSAYSGIFKKTDMLSAVENKIERLAEKTSPFAAILVTSIFTGMIACNQTLSIMLSNQLCHRLRKNVETFAIDLENSAVIISPLIPWCIAGAVPLATVSAPTSSIFFAFYLYLLPLCYLFHQNNS